MLGIIIIYTEYNNNILVPGQPNPVAYNTHKMLQYTNMHILLQYVFGMAKK